MQHLYIETWGCQMNEYDSEKMAQILQKSHGLSLIDDPQKADVLLLNTCSIREKAQEKVFSLLGMWKKIKQKRPRTMIGLGGCVASQEGEAIFKRASYVDFVFGPQTLQKLPSFINRVLQGYRHEVDIAFTPEQKFDSLPKPRAEGPCAYVTVQEGCSKFCKYCIVPFTRGQEVNRPFEDIIDEVHQLALQGVREITLLGQNVNAYQGQLPTSQEADLAMLIYYISHIDGIDRIRFTTSHPVEFSETLIDAYQHVPELVSHLHLPVQSGSNNVLSAMGRGHTREQYIEKILKLKEVRPHLSISSDFIVGFPGESEEDFEQTLSLVKQLDLDTSYSFIYSKRPGTLAASYQDEVSKEIAKDRLERLQSQLNEQASAHSQKMLHHVFDVLVAGYSKDSHTLYGRTENNRIVHLVNAHESMIGTFVQAHITQIFSNSLQGRVVNITDSHIHSSVVNLTSQEEVIL